MSLPTNGPKAPNLAASKRYLASCPVATPMDCVWLHQKAGDTEFRRVLRVSRSTYTFLKDRLVAKGYYQDPKKRARKDAMSIDERISIALARMGTQAENESVGDSFGVVVTPWPTFSNTLPSLW